MCAPHQWDTHQIVAAMTYISTALSLWWSCRFTLVVCLIRFTPFSLALTSLPYGVLCLIRVYALYDRSSLVLRLLVTIILGGFINAIVCLFSLDASSVWMHILLFFKAVDSHRQYRGNNCGRNQYSWMWRVHPIYRVRGRTEMIVPHRYNLCHLASEVYVSFRVTALRLQ